MAKDHFKQVKNLLSQVIEGMKTNFFPIPNKTCSCGKAIVFIYPKKTFKCSRCGSKYILNITIAQRKGR